METSTTPAPVAAPEVTAPDAQAPETVENPAPETTDNPEGRAPEGPEAKAPDANKKGLRLTEILAEIKRDPSKELNDADLEIFMEYDDGKGKLKPLKGEAPEPKDVKPDEKKEAEKVEKTEKPEKPSISPEIEAAMKEVGAKDPSELPAKIKELRAKVSGKETEAVTALKSQHEANIKSRAENEAALWKDWMAGKPAAVEYARKVYGVEKAAPVAPQAADKPFDEDADILTGGALSRAYEREQALQRKIDELAGEWTSHKEKSNQQTVKQSVAAQVVDEMIEVASTMDGIKEIPGLRNAIIDRVVNGKEDPRLDAFNDLFQIAEENGTTLKAAYLIKRGRDADLLIEKAREAGRQEAYKHTPNKSLSGIAIEAAQPQTISDEQIDAMENDYRLIPDNWYTGGKLDKAKIPKKAWAALGVDH